MKIPKEIAKRLIWTQRNDENWKRIADIIPAKACECGITPQREPVYKIHRVETPFPHSRTHCDYCKKYSVTNTGQWFDTTHEINAHLRSKENFQKITNTNSKD